MIICRRTSSRSTLRINKANGEENECKLAEVLNVSYRSEVLSKEFNTIEEYLQAWIVLQDKFVAENDSFKRYEVWCNFSKEKLAEGCAKILRKIDMKKGLKEKHMEVELNRLNSMLELKKGDTEEREKVEKELHRYKEERIAFSKRQQDLTEEVIA